MIITGIPQQLLSDLRAVPHDRPVSLLMRHSARFPILDPALTFEIGLTEEGVYLAEVLGEQIGRQFQPGRLMSTPVGRCVATAEAIARGAGWSEKVTVDERLSHPFMAPALRQVEQNQLNGTLPWQISATLHLLVHASEPEMPAELSHLNIAVTHDTVLCAMVGGLLHAPVFGQNWPEFLEGVFFWKANGRLYARWRGEEMTVADPGGQNL